ncbi:2-phospho-L-lactate guanylyltransferase [Ferrovibrio sp.]|uniref:2-phospho-L-lactate guanylyltransferase n=1 Tax=Ferrovibrio sp. TaxID=1917215 RepID=UPI003D28CB55
MPPLVLIPCRPFTQGKSRLAPVLNPAAREALCRRFLHDTLARIATLVPKSDIHVVTADREATAMAAAAGISTLEETQAGLNEALSGAITQLARQRQDFQQRSLLLLPTDLPLATPAALRAALDMPADILLVPDHAGQGTNLLRLGPGIAPRFSFRFGPGSFLLHQAEAARLGITPRLLPEPTLACDIDTPEDYAAWQAVAEPTAFGQRQAAT